MKQYVVERPRVVAEFSRHRLEGAAFKLGRKIFVAEHGNTVQLSPRKQVSFSVPKRAYCDKDNIDLQRAEHCDSGMWVRFVDTAPNGDVIGFYHGETNGCYKAPNNHTMAVCGIASYKNGVFSPAKDKPLFSHAYDPLIGEAERTVDNLRAFSGVAQFGLVKHGNYLYGNFNVLNKAYALVRYPLSMLYRADGSHDIEALYTERNWEHNTSGYVWQRMPRSHYHSLGDYKHGVSLAANSDGVIAVGFARDEDGVSQKGLRISEGAHPEDLKVLHEPLVTYERRQWTNPLVSDMYRNASIVAGPGNVFTYTFELWYAYGAYGFDKNEGMLAYSTVNIMDAPEHHPRVKIALNRYRMEGQNWDTSKPPLSDAASYVRTIAYLWPRKADGRPMRLLYDSSTRGDNWTRYRDFAADKDNSSTTGYNQTERLVGWIIPPASRGSFSEFSDGELLKLYRCRKRNGKTDRWISYAAGGARDSDIHSKLWRDHKASEKDITFLGWALK